MKRQFYLRRHYEISNIGENSNDVNNVEGKWTFFSFAKAPIAKQTKITKKEIVKHDL